MERRFVIIVFVLVISGSKLIQSGEVPTNYAAEDGPHETEYEVTTKEFSQYSQLVRRENSPSEDDKEVLLKLHHLEWQLQQMENMIKKNAEVSCQETTMNMLSSKVVYLESKILQQEEDFKQLTNTMAMRSIKTDDDEHETLLSKIEILGNIMTQQNDDVKQTVEVTLENKFKQLENKVKKTLEEATPGPVVNESAENTLFLLSTVNNLQEKISLLEINTNRITELVNKSAGNSFGYETKLLQLTNEFTSMNEKIVTSLAYLVQLNETVSEVLSKLDLDVEQSISSMLDYSLENLQQQINYEIKTKNDHINDKLELLVRSSFKVPDLFVELQQLIAQNLSQILSNSNELAQPNNRCVNNKTLKQVLFDLIIFKNTDNYYQFSNRQHSCKDKALKTSSGKYLLHPNLEEEPFVGYCEQNKFGGGWLVIQHRFNGSVDFYRGWKDYRNGFGTIDGEFWLGLETLHRLTKDKQFTLVIEIKTFNGSYAYAMYDRFEIGSEAEGYSLKRLGSYSGSASDGLSYSEGMKFTTWDSDNDQATDYNCAIDRQGAWWYRKCTNSNLNGKYQNKVSNESLCWYVFDKTDTGLMMSRMMIREA
nr:angiopoietin-1-like isoform X2 [Aedes albopictus]